MAEWLRTPGGYLPAGEWLDVPSGWIDSLMHDGTDAWMRVRRGGKTYPLPGMSLGVFYRWVTAASKGVFFNAFVRGKYGHHAPSAAAFRRRANALYGPRLRRRARR